jgi:hypothetical protein
MTVATDTLKAADNAAARMLAQWPTTENRETEPGVFRRSGDLPSRGSLHKDAHNGHQLEPAVALS